MEVVTLSNIIWIKSDAADHIQHGGIQFFCIDLATAGRICAFVVEVPLPLLLHRSGTHEPLRVAMTPDETGKQISILLPTGTRNVVFFAGKFRLNSVEHAALNDRLMFARKHLVLIGDLANIKAIPQDPVNMLHITDPVAVRRLYAFQFREIAPIAPREIRRKYLLNDSRFIRDDLDGILHVCAATISERYSSPCDAPL